MFGEMAEPGEFREEEHIKHICTHTQSDGLSVAGWLLVGPPSSGHRCPGSDSKGRERGRKRRRVSRFICILTRKIELIARVSSFSSSFIDSGDFFAIVLLAI